MNIKARLEEVRSEYLYRMTRGDGELLCRVEHYITAHEGKMLRPKMVLHAAATLGDEVFLSRRTLLAAVCVEMLHNVSLLHDDVIDKADQRRGRPSVNTQWNNAVAVLVGDYCLAQIMQLLEEIDDRELSRRVNATVQAMVEAELMAQEVESRRSEVGGRKSEVGGTSDLLPQTSYLRIVDGKTASLFGLAAYCGNPACEEYGLHYGRLFQLRDDIADGEAPSFAAELIRQEEETLRAIKPQLPELI